MADIFGVVKAPLHIAVLKHYYDIVKLLLSHKDTNINIKDIFIYFFYEIHIYKSLSNLYF